MKRGLAKLARARAGMYPPPHTTCMYPPPHTTCMYPPPHTTCMCASRCRKHFQVVPQRSFTTAQSRAGMYPPPHMACTCPPPMACMYPSHLACMYPPPRNSGRVMSTSSVVHLLNLEQLTPTERQRMTKLEEQRQRYFLFFIFLCPHC